ncbi:adenylate kinase-domain-containing protein [Spinellus fusiger]|nr:adenylate kinase-domain-containing protein [Spinellus fusiger]
MLSALSPLKLLCRAKPSSHVRRIHDCALSDAQPMRILLLGSPGAGKGTQSERLVKNFSVTHLSSGDLLRKHIAQQTPTGRKAAESVASGRLVPDELILGIINTELSTTPNPHWLLDGFPRTQTQAQALDVMLNKRRQPLNLVIHLEVPEQVILERIINRWVHVPSGRVYNLSYNPPRVPGMDDVTGEPLSKRPDDCPEVFQVRLAQHKAMTMPLLDHYSSIVANLKGNTSDEIYPQIEREIVNRLGILPGSLPPPPMSLSQVVSTLHQQRQQKVQQTMINNEAEALTETLSVGASQ